MNHAVILAGGLATRLQPLTDEIPKSLLPIGPTCLLELQIILLRQVGVTAITVAAGSNAEAIRGRFGDGSALGVHLQYLPEPDPLGSGGAVRAAAATWTEPFWALNGDVVIALDFPTMAKRHGESGAWASMAVSEVGDASGFGIVELAAGDAIRRFTEKPAAAEPGSRLVNAGVWLLDPRVRDLLPAQGFASVEYDLFPALLRAGHRLQGYRAGDYWADMGTPDRYLQVATDMVMGRLPPVAGWPSLSGGRYIDATAEIDAKAGIDSPAIIGAGSRVAGGAQVAHSLLWDGVTVDSDARVERSIIADGATIGPGVQLQNAVVGRRARVTRSPAPGARIPTDAQQ